MLKFRAVSTSLIKNSMYKYIAYSRLYNQSDNMIAVM